MSVPSVPSVQRTVLLRAASGSTIGNGHVMRTRALAQAVQGLGFRARVRVDDAATAAGLALQGFDADVAAEDDAVGVVAGWLDGFRDWGDEIYALHYVGARAALVENRRPERDRADWVVYPCLHYHPDPWDEAHVDKVRGGARWTPLSAEVLEQEPASERDVDLLISFGGSDPRGLTERTLTALATIGPLAPRRIALVLGPHMVDRGRAVAELCGHVHAEVQLVEAPTGLAPWIARSRVAVTALGTTLYELAWLGVPALVLANYDSDRTALSHYRSIGPHRPLGISEELDDEALARELALGLEELYTESAVRSAQMAQVAQDLHGGSERLARLLTGALG